jgi:transposase
VKVDAFKIREIARKLGVSERTVEEYLLDKLTMMDEGERPGEDYARTHDRSPVVDRFGRPLEEDAG